MNRETMTTTVRSVLVATIHTYDGQPHTQSYGYDPFGNTTSMTGDDAADLPTVVTATNRYEEPDGPQCPVGVPCYDYDAAGNLLGLRVGSAARWPPPTAWHD